MKDVLISKSNAFLNWEGERNGGRKGGREGRGRSGRKEVKGQERRRGRREVIAIVVRGQNFDA